MMSAATVPTALADDFTNIIAAVDGGLADGQAEFGLTATDFSSSYVTDALAALFNGIDDDLAVAPDNLLIGTAAPMRGGRLPSQRNCVGVHD